MTMLSDRELLDALKEQFDLANDCQLCDMLAMSPTQISHIRAVINPRPLTLMQKLVAYDHLGYAWAREALLNLVPDHLGAKLRAMDIDKTKARADKSNSRSSNTKDAGMAGLIQP